MKPVGPIFTVELFPGLSAELLSLLEGLPGPVWEAQTVCPNWSVKDVAAHLLGGNLGRLSFGRDRLAGPKPGVEPKDFAELLAYINRSNARWIDAARGISPGLLIEFLELTDPQLYDYFNSLLPFELDGLGVAWAGETRSTHWFDIAREYTEKWHHQQPIREAVGQPLLMERMWLYPVLDTFMRALPYTYRGLDAAEGTAISVHINGDAGGDWSLLRQAGEWRLFSGVSPDAVSVVRLDQDLAWRLFTKGVSRESAQAKIETEGDSALGMGILQMVSIMA